MFSVKANRDYLFFIESQTDFSGHFDVKAITATEDHLLRFIEVRKAGYIVRESEGHWRITQKGYNALQLAKQKAEKAAEDAAEKRKLEASLTKREIICAIVGTAFGTVLGAVIDRLLSVLF